MLAQESTEYRFAISKPYALAHLETAFDKKGTGWYSSPRCDDGLGWPSGIAQALHWSGTPI